jgi:hypothetical protein
MLGAIEDFDAVALVALVIGYLGGRPAVGGQPCRGGSSDSFGRPALFTARRWTGDSGVSARSPPAKTVADLAPAPIRRLPRQSS